MRRPLPLLLIPALTVVAHLPAAPTPKVLSPAGTVARQIELFNAHDLEGFLGLFAEEVEVAVIPGSAAPAPGSTAPTGKAKLRELYAARFKANPDLHASATAQIVSGDFVVQKEKLSGRAGKPNLEALVIYQVKAGRIVRMWGVGE